MKVRYHTHINELYGMPDGVYVAVVVRLKRFEAEKVLILFAFHNNDENGKQNLLFLELNETLSHSIDLI